MGDPAERVSVERYLELDLAFEGKLEYFDGVIVAMAGASPRHNLIAMNVGGELRAALEDAPCLVVGSDQRVRISLTRAYVYPDVTVTCGEPRFSDEHPASLLNPNLVVEVLSSSTMDHDRGTKFSHYRRLASVKELLFVHHNVRAIERYRRLDDGTWAITDIVEGSVELVSVGVQLEVDAIYAKVDGLPID